MLCCSNKQAPCLSGLPKQIYSVSYLITPSPLLIATGESIPLLCVEGVPGLPGAPQDDAFKFPINNGYFVV